jgi:hypothetical protein
MRTASCAAWKPVEFSVSTKSRKNVNNPRLGITGILCYSGDQFIQVLEGGRDEACELFNTIGRDPRHERVHTLTHEAIAERRFNG